MWRNHKVEYEIETLVRRQPRIFDFARESKDRGDVNELKKLLDAMRGEDAQEENL